MYIKNNAFVGSAIWIRLEKFITIAGTIAKSNVITPKINHNSVYLKDSFFFLVTTKIKIQNNIVLIIKIICNVLFTFKPPFPLQHMLTLQLVQLLLHNRLILVE